MRGLLRATIITALCLVTITQSHAQRPTESAAADQRAPANVRFRARTAEERLASVRRLDAEARRGTRGTAASPPLLNFTMNDTFSLTPRTPFVPGQGAMDMKEVKRIDSSAAPSGDALFRPAYDAGVTLHITNSGSQRLLIECNVWTDPAGTYRAILIDPPGPIIWQENSTPYGDLISFLTPPMPEGTGPNFEFSVQREQQLNWHLLGCQVTRMAPP